MIAGYELSLDHSRLQIEVVHKALAASYWSPGVRREVLEKAFQHSLVIGAFVAGSGEQVAFARVVTDQATFAWLADVWVGEAHRKRGIAKQMLAELLAHPRLQTCRRSCLATRDMQGLYAQLGFVPVAQGRWMEKLSGAEVWQEPTWRKNSA